MITSFDEMERGTVLLGVLHTYIGYLFVFGQLGETRDTEETELILPLLLFTLEGELEIPKAIHFRLVRQNGKLPAWPIAH